MSKSRNYQSYFDEENDEMKISQDSSPQKEVDYHSDNNETKKGDERTYKAPLPKARKNSGDEFDKPFPPILHKKLIKDVKDLKDFDLEELNSFPFLNNISDKKIEKYESLDHLYQNYSNDSNDEYQVIDLEELKNLMGSQLNNEMFVENCSTEEQIATLEKEFEQDKENYEILYKLIYLYRINKNSVKLKEMREHTFALFPLGEDMWKEWIDDELLEVPPDDFNHKYSMIKLYFERALNDFWYFRICKKLMKFLLKLKKETEIKKIIITDEFAELKVENIRKRFEDFLQLWGLDFNQASILWDLYLSFENSNLEHFKKENDQVNIDNTIHIIRSIYRRRLTFPHIDVDIIWQDYQKWEKSADELLKVEIKYKQSSQKAEDMINLEENFNELINITKTEDDSQKLCDYLKNDISTKFKKYKNYIRLYYERALEINPDDENIWKDYIEFIKSSNKNNHVTLNILKRACKCCYFNVIFWVLLLREMEKCGNTFEEIQVKIHEAYTSDDDPNFLSEIWKYSLEFYCRNFDQSVEQLQQLRTLFEAAIKDIKSKGNAEYLNKIYNIWVEFETFKVKDIGQVNTLMNIILKDSPTADNWKNFIFVQKYFGDTEAIRKAYKRTIEYCKDEKETLSESWISWEKIFGSIKDIENALNFSKKKVIKPRLKLKNKTLKEEANPPKERTYKKIKRNTGENKNEKFDANEEELEENEAESRTSKSETQLNENNSQKTVIIKNLPLETNEDSLESFIKSNGNDLPVSDIRIVRDKKGNSKGYAFIDFFTIEEAARCAGIIHNKSLDDHIVSCAISKPPKLGENDLRTLFVNNISFTSDENSIKSAFEQFGDILDVRIIYDKETKKPRGYCYVEFSDENTVNKILAEKSDLKIDGRKVVIKRSQSVVKLRENIKFVSHITNIPYSYSEKNLKEFFNKNGINNIIDCIIIKDDKGDSKGFGFVEFEDEDNLKKAINLSGTLIRGRPILIKLSTRNITQKGKRDERSQSDVVKTKKRKLEDNKEQIVKIKNENTMGNKDFKKFLK